MSNEYEVFVFKEYNNTGEMRAEPLTKRGGKMPRLKGMNTARLNRIFVSECFEIHGEFVIFTVYFRKDLRMFLF